MFCLTYLETPHPVTNVAHKSFKINYCALRDDFLLFVKFEKRKKLTWRRVTFSKVAG